MRQTDDIIVTKFLKIRPKLLVLRALATEILSECNEIDTDDNSLNTSTIDAAVEISGDMEWLDGMLSNCLDAIDEAKQDLEICPEINLTTD